MIRLFLPALLMMVLVGSARAQHPIVRLSADQQVPVLPDDIRIQAASSIGDRTLVVWGSTMRDRNDSVRSVLYGQIVVGKRSIGSPSVVSFEDATPTTRLEVIALRDRFLVVWDEHAGRILRSRARVVDTVGAGGADFLLSDSGSIAPGLVALRRGDGTKLLWNDTAAPPRSYVLDLDASGTPIDKRSVTGAFRIGGVVGTMEGGRITIIDRAELPPLLVDEAGGFYELTVSERAKLLMPYDVGPDGTVVTLTDSTARFFHSLRDTLPFRTLIVHPPPESFAEVLFPSIDSLSRFQFTFPVINVSNAGTLDQKWLEGALKRVTNIRDSTFGDTMVIGSFSSKVFSHCDHRLQGKITDVKFTRGCRGQYDITYFYKYDWVYDCEGRNDWRNGSDSDVVQYWWVIARSCGTPVNMQPARLDGNGSIVGIDIDGDTTTLSAPAASSLKNIVESSAGVVTVGDSLLVGFVSNDPTVTGRLIRWSPASDATEDLASFPGAWDASHNASLFRTTSTLSIAPAADRMLLCRSRAWLSLTPNGDTIPGSALDFFVPTTYGWNTPFVTVSFSRYRPARYVMISSDPDAGTCLIVAKHDQYEWDWDVLSLDRENRLRWRVEGGPSGKVAATVIMPLDSDLFRVHDAAKYRQLYRGVLDSVLDFSTAPPYTSFERLFGGMTLGAGGNRTDVMLYNRDGAPQLPAAVELFDSAAVNPRILQSPRDSSIIILYAASGAIRMVQTDRWLRVVEPDHVAVPVPGSVTDISDTFIGDSLAIVWKEMRGGVSDIFGTIVPLDPVPSFPSSVPRKAHDGARLRLVPNPASGLTLLRRRDAGHVAEIIVTDLQGRVVLSRRAEAGEEMIELDTSALPAGVYLVRAGAEGCAPLCVMR